MDNGYPIQKVRLYKTVNLLPEYYVQCIINSQKKKKSYSVNQKDQPNNINLQDQPGSVEPQEGVKTNDHEGTAQSNGNNTSNGDAEANQDPQQAIQRSKDKVNAQETSDCEYAKFRVSIVLA